MLVPISWLKDYIGDISVNIKDFTDMMTLTGTKVEAIEYRGEYLTNIVAAKVEEIIRHPDSDHMWVCKLNDGENIHTIVTGAQNVRQGDIVPLARNNSVIYGGKKIKESPLRGIISSGMLCSAEELGIAGSIVPKNQEEGIYILDEDIPLGEDIKKVLNLDDYVIEFELTNNRQDCNSILGIAHEASATLGEKFTYPKYEFSSEKNDIDKYLSVEVDDYSLCHRYVAKMVRIKEIKPSPLWMQTRLMAVGIRPINNVVDVSNFVMVETGQPLHTFDYNKLAGNKIHVKSAFDGQKFTTLDKNERILNSDVLMINDAEKPIAIAGIMGGLNSDIDENTTAVVIEAATFEKLNIRKSSKYLGLRSESSSHFEKGISIHLAKYAADRAAQLLCEIGAGELVEGVIDKYDSLDVNNPIDIDINWFNNFVGINITAEKAKNYLNLLNFDTIINGDILTVTPFKLRQDILIKEDVAEEIIRLFGYENIPLTLMKSSNYISAANDFYRFKQKIKALLVGVGCTETLTYSFINPDQMKLLNLNETDIRNDHIIVRNPLGSDTSIMRTTLVPNMLELLKTNFNKKNKPKIMFEIGNVYLKNEDATQLPNQAENLIICKYNTDFYEIKSIFNYLFDSLKIPEIAYIRADESYLHPGKSAYIKYKNDLIGTIGQIHPQIAKKNELPDDICLGEVNIEWLYKIAAEYSSLIYKPIAKYPSSERDIALVCDENILADQIKEIIYKYGGKHLIYCEVFDVYRSDAIGDNKKSIAFNLSFRSDNATLTDDVIDKNITKIVKALEEQLNAILR